MSKWSDNSEFGFFIENFLVDFFEENFDWKFRAGNLNGKLVNKEYIEETYSCKVLESVEFTKGQTIVFDDGEEYLMPDLLFIGKFGGDFWAESKSSRDFRYETIDVSVKSFEDYFSVGERTKRPSWLIISSIRENGNLDVYASTLKKIKRLIENGKIEKVYNRNWGKDVYRINPSLLNILVSDLKVK